jgi:two-component SAPR family response regulator
LFNSITAQDFLNEGLYFSSHEVKQEFRTSLNLTPNEPLKFKNKITIEFQANFRPGDGYYGNILQLVCNKDFNLNLVANLDNQNETFWIAIKDELIFKYKWSDIPKGDFNKWIKFQLTLDTQSSEISLSINGHKTTKKNNVVGDIDYFDFVFGKNVYKSFTTTDVCPMSIKGIKIFNQDDNLIRYWSLGKHTKVNKVYDEIQEDLAIVENPKWLIDQHVFWDKHRDFSFNELLGTATDITNNRVFFIESNLLNIYDIGTKSIKTLNYNNYTLKCKSNSFIYNNLTNKLIAYSISENLYKTFDFKTLTWSDSDIECLVTAHHHHNALVSPQDSTLVTFGGYGYYTYKSKIYNFKTNPIKIDTFDLRNDIAPRYLSASGILNSNEFLIFGGYGSPSGKQGVGSRIYNDLYSVNFKNFKPKKIWQSNTEIDKPSVPVSTMIIDDTSDSFYTLTYDNSSFNTNLRLASYGISEYKLKFFPDSIPYQFLDTKSNVDFFLNSEKSKLNVLTKIENKATLYSLSYPPLMAEDIYQEEIKNKSQKWFWILLVIIVTLLAPIYIIFRKKGWIYKYGYPKKTIDYVTPIDNNEKTETIKTSAIYLFGGFQVYNRHGEDITAQFTPTLKQLFLIILLSSTKNGKGVSSIKLTDLLWPDKSETKARNNRNVNISKLRLLLEKIGDGIDLNNKNTYWRLELGPSVFCDYIFVKKTLAESSKHPLEREQIIDLLQIIGNGEISPDLQTDWIEDFKEGIINLLVDDLLQISNTQDDPQILIKISNNILKYAPLSEEAISLKCKTLYKMGRKGVAKQSYDEFCDAYFEILDSKFDKSFKELIQDI